MFQSLIAQKCINVNNELMVEIPERLGRGRGERPMLKTPGLSDSGVMNCFLLRARNHLGTKQGAMPYFVVFLRATHYLTNYIYIREL